MFPVWSDWDIKYTTKGLYKRHLSGMMKLVALTALVVAAACTTIKSELFDLQSGVSLARSGFRSMIGWGIGCLISIHARLNV